jgi:hypothetical protein
VTAAGTLHASERSHIGNATALDAAAGPRTLRHRGADLDRPSRVASRRPRAGKSSVKKHSVNVPSRQAGQDVHGTVLCKKRTASMAAAAVARTDEYGAKYREGIKRIGMTVEEMSNSFSVSIRAQPEHIRS